MFNHSLLVHISWYVVVRKFFPNQPIDVVQNIKQVIFFWAMKKNKKVNQETNKKTSLPQLTIKCGEATEKQVLASVTYIYVSKNQPSFVMRSF